MAKRKKKINLDEIESVSTPDKEGKITVKTKKKVKKQVHKEVKEESKPVQEEYDWDNHKIKKNNDNFFGLL